MLARMSLDELVLFSRVVDTGSFTAAAKAAGVPTSTVSRAVARLEDELRVRLLERTSRKVAPTEDGLALHQEIAPHVAALSRATDVLAAREERPSGLLRVTAPPDLAAHVLPELVVAFTQRYPDVSVELDFSVRFVDLVAEGFDLAIRGGRLRDSSLVARRIVSSDIALYASPAYLARRGVPKTPSDIESHDCVVRPSDTRRVRMSGPKGACHVEMKGAIRCGHFDFVLAAARAGAGIALLPSMIVRADLVSGALVRVLPGHSVDAGSIYVLHASSKHVPRKVSAFRDLIIEAAARGAFA